MSETEFTPGPWEIIEHSWAETGIYGGGRRIALLDIESDATEETQEEWEAKQREDARLISAAPDMYETLQTIASFAVGNGDVCEIIARRARAALAKASA